MPKNSSPLKKRARQIQKDTGIPYTAALRQAQAEADARATARQTQDEAPGDAE